MNNHFSREIIDAERERSSRFVKITFGVMALVCLALGLLVVGFAPPLGIPHDTARPIAMALLCTAITATAVLYVWDRIFKRRS
jgi:hypothetical protein